MSKTLFKRAAATGAAFIAIGSAGAMTMPAVASAATTPAVSQSAHAAQADMHPMLFCYKNRDGGYTCIGHYPV
jgi:hypothetical protein